MIDQKDVANNCKKFRDECKLYFDTSRYHSHYIIILYDVLYSYYYYILGFFVNKYFLMVFIIIFVFCQFFFIGCLTFPILAFSLTSMIYQNKFRKILPF